MSDETEPITGVLRRTVLKTSAVVVGSVGMVGTTAADSHTDDEDGGENGSESEDVNDADEAVDEPDGFEVEVLAPHAPFADDLAARFCLEYAESEEPMVVELADASTSIVAEATWSEGSTSGWHRHPGISLVNIVNGEIEVTMEHDCVPRTYAAGDAWLDPGHVHIADSDGGARAYVTFLGIPDGEPATVWVPPVEC